MILYDAISDIILYDIVDIHYDLIVTLILGQLSTSNPNISMRVDNIFFFN